MLFKCMQQVHEILLHEWEKSEKIQLDDCFIKVSDCSIRILTLFSYFHQKFELINNVHKQKFTLTHLLHK